MSFATFPGPSNTDLLFLGLEHRAANIFYNYNSISSVSLNVRRCDQSFFEHFKQHPIPLPVLEYIRLAGFGGILECGFHKIDHALLTALIERWRPETHTFHLPVGEVTITLQDVQVLWGLNVDGNVVTGMEDMNFSILCEMCHTLLGFTPPEESVRGFAIKITYLIQMLNNELPEEPTDNQIQQRARLYIMILIGGIVFPDTSGNRVPIFYLLNLISLQDSASLSWGSACLAHLYRCLCRATNPKVSDVTRPLMLLQFWAWERFNAFRPRIVNMTYNYQQVYAARWSRPHSYVHIATHCLEAARQCLASLDVDDFAWTPYNQVLAILPPHCTYGRLTWCCDTYIICWEIVEAHLPSRVMRQFSFIQTIPREVLMTPDVHKKLHKMRKGKKCNWQIKHNVYIQHWYSRHQAFEGVVAQTFRPDAEYMNWYWPRTVVHVVPPNMSQSSGFQNIAGRQELLMEGLTYLHRELRNRMPGDPMAHLPQRYMEAVNASHRISIGSMHFSQDANAFPRPPPAPVQRLRREQNHRGEVLGEPSVQAPSTFVFGGSSTQPEPRMSTFDFGGPSTHPEPGPSSYDFGGLSTQQEMGPFQLPDLNINVYEPNLDL